MQCLQYVDTAPGAADIKGLEKGPDIMLTLIFDRPKRWAGYSIHLANELAQNPNFRPMCLLIINVQLLVAPCK